MPLVLDLTRMHQDQRAGREEFQVKGNNVVIAEGRSLVCKPRKMRQVRVTTQEGKQGPGNQTRSLENPGKWIKDEGRHEEFITEVSI